MASFHHPRPEAAFSLAPISTMPLYSLCSLSTSAASAAAAAAVACQLPATYTTKPSPPLILSSSAPASSISTNDCQFPLPLPDVPAHLKEKILSLEVLGVDAGRALALNPTLRTASLDSVHSVISYLLSKGIHHKDLPRILGMCPGILTASVAADLAPVFAFLARDLGVPDAHFRRVVNKCPRLLASSVRDQLRPALIYLRRLGFLDDRALAYQEPVLLVSSVERTMMPKLDFLAALGMAREEAVAMVRQCPGLFTFSIERNLRPKYEYFAGEMGGALEELKEFPQYFAFSLEKRIKPRHRWTRERGVRLPLATVLKATDEEFEKLMEEKEAEHTH